MYILRKTLNSIGSIMTRAIAIAALTIFAVPAFAQDIDIDHITTGSIATSRAMIWTVDPMVVLSLLAAGFLGLCIVGFALMRRSMRDMAKEARQFHNRFQD